MQEKLTENLRALLNGMDAETYARQRRICEVELADVEARLEELEKALAPFAHADLCKYVGGNAMGEDSIVFQRDAALLRIRDFRTAARIISQENKCTRCIEAGRKVNHGIAAPCSDCTRTFEPEPSGDIRGMTCWDSQLGKSVDAETMFRHPTTQGEALS